MTARLQSHVDAAVADYESGAISMSPNQARAAALNPNLEPAYRGSVIDQAAKARIVRWTRPEQRKPAELSLSRFPRGGVPI